jgi:spectinomycin phosphotransferase
MLLPMIELLREIITAEYGLHGVRITIAPRQFVAETYRVTTADEQTFFCKVVDKPLWIPKILGSLPVLDAIHNVGFMRANYPIKTLSRALHVMRDGSLIVLFNFIEAQQSYTFDDAAFGRLLGQVHALTHQIDADVPQERFFIKHADLFERKFDALLATKSDDEITEALQRVLRKHEIDIRNHYAMLQELSAQCRQMKIDVVITHGDAGGNVLVKSPADLYLIDWDEILLAPVERDLWVHANRPAFMAGYRSVFPDYQTNELARRYCVCSQYFDYIAYFLADIMGDFPSEDRVAKLHGLEQYFEDWIKPYIESIY